VLLQIPASPFDLVVMTAQPAVLQQPFAVAPADLVADRVARHRRRHNDAEHQRQRDPLLGREDAAEQHGDLAGHD
jgi:hypothetical protein